MHEQWIYILQWSNNFFKIDIIKCIFYWHVKDFNTSFHCCKRSRTSYEKKDLEQSHLSDIHFFWILQYKEIIFLPPKAAPESATWFHLISGLLKDLSKVAEQKAHLWRQWFRHLMTNWGKKEETGCFTITLHKVIFVSLNFIPWPGNSSKTFLVLLSSDNRYTFIPAGNGNSDPCIYFH